MRQKLSGIQHHHRIPRAKYPEAAHLLPDDSDLALRVRLSDRFYDLYVHETMQRIVGDRLRPADERDPDGVEQARADLDKAPGLVDRDMESGGWATGLTFTMARLRHGEVGRRAISTADARPSCARARSEPYFSMSRDPETRSWVRHCGARRSTTTPTRSPQPLA